MSGPLIPDGYDVAKAVRTTHERCRITVGFDRKRTGISRFIVVLHYLPPSSSWTLIARFDHNETASSGHDVYSEGLHIDVSDRTGTTTKISPSHGPLPRNGGAVVRLCVDYFDSETQYFVDVYNGDIRPGSPPGWPDGGDSADTLLSRDDQSVSMRGDNELADPISISELTDLLAEVTGTDASEIDALADEVEIETPEEADTVAE